MNLMAPMNIIIASTCAAIAALALLALLLT